MFLWDWIHLVQCSYLEFQEFSCNHLDCIQCFYCNEFHCVQTSHISYHLLCYWTPSSGPNTGILILNRLQCTAMCRAIIHPTPWNSMDRRSGGPGLVFWRHYIRKYTEGTILHITPPTDLWLLQKQYLQVPNFQITLHFLYSVPSRKIKSNWSYLKYLNGIVILLWGKKPGYTALPECISSYTQTTTLLLAWQSLVFGWTAFCMIHFGIRGNHLTTTAATATEYQQPKLLQFFHQHQKQTEKEVKKGDRLEQFQLHLQLY